MRRRVFILVINRIGAARSKKRTKALGITVLPTLLAQANEVIE